MVLHEASRLSMHDPYFVSGGNPDGNGGGVIGSTRTRVEALALQIEAVKRGYTRVHVMTYKEMSE